MSGEGWAPEKMRREMTLDEEHALAGSRGTSTSLLDTAVSASLLGAVDGRGDGLDQFKTRPQLLSELGQLRRRVAKLERDRSSEELERRNQELLALNAIAALASSTLRSSELWGALEKQLPQALEVPAGLIFSFDPAHMCLCGEMAWGLGQETVDSLRELPVARHWDRFVLRNNEPVISDALCDIIGLSTPRLVPLPGGFQKCACVPLLAKENVQGILCLFGHAEMVSSADRTRFLKAVGRHVGVAVHNAKLYKQLRLQHGKLQTLSRRLVEIQESERRYVARELHDEAGQALTSLLVGLRLLERRADDSKAVLERAAQLKGLADGVLETLHRLAEDLRPVSLRHLGLAAALRRYVQRFSEQHEIDMDLEEGDLGDERLTSAAEMAVYRIVQESLTNIARHAHAKHAGVLLERRRDCMIIIIEDNGVGFDPVACEANGRLGLLGMRERAESVGGTIEIESTIGQGASVFVEVPYGHTHSHSR